MTTGVVANGRPEVDGGEAVLGLFLNTLPLSLDVEDGDGAALVGRVFQAEQAIWPHRRFPLRYIQHLAGAERLFDTAFNYTHFHVLSDATATSDEPYLATAEGVELSDFDLVLQAGLRIDTGALRLCLDTNDRGVAPELARAYGELMVAALASLAGEPAADLLPAGDRARLASWSGDLSEVAGVDRGLTGLFAEVVAQHGMRVAVTDGLEALTYAGLTRRAMPSPASWSRRGSGRGRGSGWRWRARRG